MADEKKDSGGLFKNAFKTKPNQPDLTGSCVIAGVKYRISSWDRHTDAGNPYQSLAFTSQEEWDKNFGTKKTPESHPNSADNQFPDMNQEQEEF